MQDRIKVNRRLAEKTLLILILLGGFVMTGCGIGQTTAPSGSPTVLDTTASTTTDAAETTAAPVETTAATSAESTTAAVETTAATTTGVTEVRLGYVKAASASGPQAIEIDYIEMYTGAEAIEKALEDGSPVVEEDEDGHLYIPNDYYIRNNNPLIRTFELSSDCVIRMIPEMGGPEPSLIASYADLLTALAVRPRLMEVEVVNGLVENMAEFYLP